jgi:hypothetical protein
MKQPCKICQKIYEYCGPCAITKDLFKNAGYCGEDCYHISMILQRYGSKLLSASEAVKELKLHNIDNLSLQPAIQEYYQNIINETKPKRKAKIIEEIVPKEDVEVVVNTDRDMTTSENE